MPQVRHGEWSRRDASDMDGLSREAERSGKRVSQSVLWRTRVELRVFGAQRKNSLCLLVANVRVDIHPTRLIYSLL